MPDFADDPKTELERKAEQLRWVAWIETATYSLLFFFWVIVPNMPTRMIMGFFHGWIFIAFGVMVVWIWRSMRWRWWWIPLALLTGPLGGVLVAEKIRRHGAPDRTAGSRRAALAPSA